MTKVFNGRRGDNKVVVRYTMGYAVTRNDEILQLQSSQKDKDRYWI